MPEPTDPAAVLREMTAARDALADAVKQIRRRHRGVVFMSVLSVGFFIVYLGYAYVRYGNEVTPDLVAGNLQSALQDQMPATRDQLETNLRANAPKLVEQEFAQLQALPASFATKLQAQATDRMDKAMPAVQDAMYTSMKGALDQAVQQSAKAGGKGSDEDRLKATLAAVADVYATETLHFVDQEHATYTADALQFTDYMDRLATSPHLDRRDQLHRDMFQTIFALIRDKAGVATESPAAKPAT